MQDQKQRFLFPDSDIRGELIRLESSLASITGNRDYPMVVQSLISEAVVAVALLASTLKFKGRLALQAQGKGPLSLLMAECSDDGKVRALARHAESLPADRTNLPALLGNGRAAGLMLQRLPNQIAEADHNAITWEHLETLASTLGGEELLDLDTTTVLHRLFHDTPPQLPPAQPLAFGCTCSRERTQRALVSLGKEELQAILDEQGEATLTCDFCGHQEHFDAVDLAELIHKET